MVQVSIPCWKLTCLLMPHMFNNIHQGLKIAGPGVSRHSGRQLTHTITGKEACTGTANIDTNLGAFWSVFRMLSGWTWDREAEGFVHVCNS